mmetsp:Transcript_23241/g.59333  ORF Transcript_23241/g.59333 Transcript_23241/m.59333 type:complete len:262 (+) Transcript_23241:377-1162(+)
MGLPLGLCSGDCAPAAAQSAAGPVRSVPPMLPLTSPGPAAGGGAPRGVGAGECAAEGGPTKKVREPDPGTAAAALATSPRCWPPGGAPPKGGAGDEDFGVGNLIAAWKLATPHVGAPNERADIGGRTKAGEAARSCTCCSDAEPSKLRAVGAGDGLILDISVCVATGGPAWLTVMLATCFGWESASQAGNSGFCSGESWNWLPTSMETGVLFRGLGGVSTTDGADVATETEAITFSKLLASAFIASCCLALLSSCCRAQSP